MATKHRHQGEDESCERPGLFGLAKSIALKPFRLVLSKPALRAYLTTFLLFSTALFLLATATTAYTLFYWSYVPRIGFAKDIHLQWDDLHLGPGAATTNSRGSLMPDVGSTNSPFPHGTVSLQGDLVGAQAYDIKLELELPRTRANREVGNFMLDVSLLAPEKKKSATTASGGILETVKDGLAPMGPSDSALVLARSRRPAILHYRSMLVEAAYRTTNLPWYLLGVRHESEKLSVDVFERASFGTRGSGGQQLVPASLRLEVQSSGRMQIYSARAVFRARFRGLRWVMYNHRIASAVVFVGVFWSVEMVFAVLAWAILAAYLGPAIKARTTGIKEEDESELESADEEPAFLSDAERTFPTLSKQQPLRYRSPDVKEEKREDDGVGVRLEDIPPLATGLEADDEDEDGDYFLDSGIGTSMESGSGSRPGSVRKRRGRSSFKE